TSSVPYIGIPFHDDQHGRTKDNDSLVLHGQHETRRTTAGALNAAGVRPTAARTRRAAVRAGPVNCPLPGHGAHGGPSGAGGTPPRPSRPGPTTPPAATPPAPWPRRPAAGGRVP